MKNKIGLALSGGGYRATLFALGTLWRFNEDGLLSKLDTITSLSGGAIAAAYLQYKWEKFTFECINEKEKKYRATNFKEEIVDPLLAFCGHGIDVSSILKGVILPFTTPAEQVEKQYDRYLFKGAKLYDIPSCDNTPEFVFYATNYDTGVSVRISKNYLSDYHLGYAKGHTLSIAEAVSISSAFPPFMAPVKLDGEAWQWDTPPSYKQEKQMDPEIIKELSAVLHVWDAPMHEVLRETDPERLKALRKTLLLCDGGLFDNLALEMLWNGGVGRNYATVFSCDAGAPFAVSNKGVSGKPKGFHRLINLNNNWFSQLSRMIDVMTNQQASLRKRGLVRNFINKEYNGAYWAIKTKTSCYPDISHPISKEDEKKYIHLSNLPTQLRPFEGKDNLKLINWGFAQTDLALRQWFDATLPCRSVPLEV